MFQVHLTSEFELFSTDDEGAVDPFCEKQRVVTVTVDNWNQKRRYGSIMTTFNRT